MAPPTVPVPMTPHAPLIPMTPQVVLVPQLPGHMYATLPREIGAPGEI